MSNWIDDLADELDLPLVRMDGYDDCAIGYVEIKGHAITVCYDADKVVAKLMAEGMAEDEAYEWLVVNMQDAYVGDHTPAFLYRVGEP